MVLFLSERLFAPNGAIGAPSSCHPEEHPSPCHPEERSDEGSEDKTSYPETYDGIPYPKIVETLEEQMGGRPEHGSRNNYIFSMACHLRYICDDDPDWIATILPTYSEAKEKWMASIRCIMRQP